LLIVSTALGLMLLLGAGRRKKVAS
jgi:hypothetical protein